MATNFGTKWVIT